jgi:hypothetical protein
LQAGQSISPTNSNENLDFPINPERVAPVLRRLISPTRTRARIYDDDASLILDSRYLYTSGQVLRYDLPPAETVSEPDRNGRPPGSTGFSSAVTCRSTANRRVPMARSIPR